VTATDLKAHKKDIASIPFRLNDKNKYLSIKNKENLDI